MSTKTPKKSNPNGKAALKSASNGKTALRTQPPSKSPEPKSKSDWNILFYLAGEGFISPNMIPQLKAITDAGFEEGTNVLVYFDPNTNGKRAQIFDVNANRKNKFIPEEGKRKTVIGDGRDPFVRDIAEDSHRPGLPQIPAPITLRYFLEYARAFYPAENYIVFLMGHGLIVGNDAFLPDPDDNSAITLVELGWILRTFADKVRADGDEFHLVGFHSCSMSSAELAYELAGSANYMIGTQGSAFPGSWPYRQLLKKIFVAIDDSKDPDKGIPDQFKPIDRILRGLQDLSFYNSEDFWHAGLSADLSLCRLDNDSVAKLGEPIEKLSVVLQEALNYPAAVDLIRLAHLESQSYWQENYTDLFDFCSCLADRCTESTGIQVAIRKACERVTLALNGEMPRKLTDRKSKSDRPSLNGSGGLVVHSDFYGPAYQFSHGISIYFPWKSPESRVVENYRGYKFTREHGSKSWWIFLQEYFRVTKRRRNPDFLREAFPNAPEVMNSIQWRPENNLLRTLSDERLLSFGPTPTRIGAYPSDTAKGKVTAKAEVDLPDKVSKDLSEAGGKLLKVGGDLAKVGGDLSKVGGDLGSQAGAEVSEKVGGDLSKVEGDLLKVLGDLSKVGGDLSKVGGDLSSGKVGGDLSKVGGDLSKVGGDLSKVGGDLSKVGGDLSINGGGDLSKVGGDLSKVGGDLSKVGGDLGGLYGHTIIKNFDSPEHQLITSRRNTFADAFAEGLDPQNGAKRPSAAKRHQYAKARK